jgi:hypothetical protein
LNTYGTRDDKNRNSGQNRKTFDKNVLRLLDKRYLRRGYYFRKRHKIARRCAIETGHS